MLRTRRLGDRELFGEIATTLLAMGRDGLEDAKPGRIRERLGHFDYG